MPPFDRREALRYMGVRGAPDAGVRALVEEAAHLLEPRAHYRVLLQRLPLDWTGSLSLDGIPLPGESIRRCMRGCGEAVLLGATLGSAVDGLIRRESLTRPALALAVNGCAAAMLEHALNGTCRELSAQVEGEGLTLTGRFSPGYGDLPLTLQPALLERLQAYRIGLTVNAGGQLQPEKSVTALCGLRSGEEEQP